ncbi:MAG: DUF58 domain-containing protein [Pseudomonadales bacterium]|nr:DUF58 domain-containing protein [Pseudomonadales bacterium]
MTLRPLGNLFIVAVAFTGIWGLWLPAMAGGFWLLLTLVLSAGLALESIRNGSWRIDAQSPAAPRLHLGRRELIHFTLTSNHSRPLHVEWQVIHPAGVRGPSEKQSGTLFPGKPLVCQLPLQATRMGTTAPLEIGLRLRGALNLAWWRRQLPLCTPGIRVEPDHDNKLLTTRTSATQSGRIGKREGAGLELHHLRHYRSGDPRHALDWKATARTGRLITRVTSQEQRLQLVIALDFGRTSRLETDGLQQLGHYINLAARLSATAAANGDHVGFVSFADSVRHIVAPARGDAALPRIRRALMELECRPVESDLPGAALTVRRLLRQRAVIILLSDLHQASAASSLATALRTWLPKHQPVLVGLTSPEIAAMASTASSGWLAPYQTVAAGEYLAHLDASARSLRQLGAITLTTSPASLETRITREYQRLRARGRA